MATEKDNDYESRDGFQSSGKQVNDNNSQGGEKRKRVRVGDLRKQSYAGSNDTNNRERNPYRSNDYNNDRQQRSSYGGGQDRSRNSSYNNNRGDGGYSNNRGGGSYNRGNDRYSNNNNNDRYSNNDYNNDRRSYSNNSNNRGYSNNGGGYNNQNNRSNNYSNNGGGGYRQSSNYGNNPQRSQYNKQQGGGINRRITPGGDKRLVKPVKYKENIDPTIPLRLNKYLANAGVCSRREADSYITAGVVKVNGEIVDQLGAKVTRGDLVTFHDQPVRLESKVYVLLNKPKNCVTTSDDPQNRVTVMDLVKNACPERIYPVGRLDRNTVGVLLLTNDGDLASKLTHPKFVKKKIYQVTLDKDVAIEDMQTIADGIELDDGEIHADSIAYQAEDVLNVVGIEIHSGRNRIVRRIFEKLGYQVLKLDRVYFAGLTKKNLPRGRWRYLTEKEVNMLRMGAFE